MTGPAIGEDALERIFERFYTDRPHQGFGQNSGLGLSISKQIIEAHGGRIWAENRPGPADERGQADGGRRALRGQAAGAMTERASERPRLRRQGRRPRRADPGPFGRRQVAAGFRSDPGRALRAGSRRPFWSAMTVSISTQPARQLWVRPAPRTGRPDRNPGARNPPLRLRRARRWWAWSWISRLRTRSGCRRRKRFKSGSMGFELPRIPVGAGFSPLPLVVAALTTTESSSSGNHKSDCLKGIGNHISPTIATE